MIVASAVVLLVALLTVDARAPLGSASGASLVCPQSLRVSRPSHVAPDPALLGYRTRVFTGSQTDIEKFHEGYAPFALQASRDEDAFSTFRQTYWKNRYAGIEQCGPGGDQAGTQPRMQYKYECREVFSVEKSLADAGRTDLLQRAIPIIQRLDHIGSGHTFPMHGPTHAGVNVSAVFLHYLGKVADLERLFGSLDGMHLVEIGVGFGGFASLLLALHPKIASYTLLDLPEVLNLAQRFLNASGSVTSTKTLYLNAAPCGNPVTCPGTTRASHTCTATNHADFETRPRGYDLAISMYAYAELPATVRKVYYEIILSKSKRGWVSDHARHIKFKDVRNVLAQNATRGLVDVEIQANELGSKVVTGLLLPEMLVHGTATGSSQAATVVGANVPDVGNLIVIRDRMRAYRPLGNPEAQVGWGVQQDYFPRLLGGPTHAWVYPIHKETIAGPTTCLYRKPQTSCTLGQAAR